MDAAAAPRCLLRGLNELKDPRVERTKRHSLNDILIITILAVICGADGFSQIALFGRSKIKWLKTFLELPHGIPSHDTFGRVLAALDPDQFERWIMQWTANLAKRTQGRVLAIDGKTLRRSFQSVGKQGAIHMVNAWCASNHLVLGQLATDEKSNEITAVPKLLELLDISGAIVTVDALNCQKDIAQKIVAGGGDYLLQVKANHATLHQQLITDLDEAVALNFDGMKHDYAQTTDGDHGRIETRRLWCTSDVSWVPNKEAWAKLTSVAVMECKREVIGQAASVQRRYYISSLPACGGDDAKQMLAAARGHWSVENQLHWSLDVGFREDDCRIRTGHGAENFARLRRLSINLLKAETTTKVGLASKRLRCGWDHDYLLKVLAAASD
ncbi:MAG: ISAs1 family transposase [Dokdonella sp.]